MSKIDELAVALGTLINLCNQSLTKITQLLANAGETNDDPAVQSLLDEVNSEISTMSAALTNAGSAAPVGDVPAATTDQPQATV